MIQFLFLAIVFTGLIALISPCRLEKPKKYSYIQPCNVCDGKSYIDGTVKVHKGGFLNLKTCKKCNDAAKYIEITCDCCGGKGYIDRDICLNCDSTGIKVIAANFK